MQKTTVHRSRRIAAIPLAIMLVVTVFPYIQSAVYSFKDFYAESAFSEQAYIDLQNYADFFTDTSAPLLFRNAVLLECGVLITGALYTFFCVFGISNIRNRRIRGIGLCIAVLPALIPANLVLYMIYPAAGAFIERFCRLLIIMYEGITWGAVATLACVLACRNGCSLKKCLCITVCAVCIKLTLFFACDLYYCIMTSSPSAMKKTETLNTFIYWRQNVDGDYGYSSAVSVIQAVCSMLSAAAGAVLFPIVLHKRHQSEPVRQSSKGSVWFALVPILITAVCAVVLVSKIDMTSHAGILQRYGFPWFFRALLLPLAPAPLLLIVSIPLAYAVSVKNTAVTILCLLLTPLTANTVCIYFFLRRIIPYGILLNISAFLPYCLPVMLLLVLSLPWRRYASFGRFICGNIPVFIIALGMIYTKTASSVMTHILYRTEELTFARVIGGMLNNIQEPTGLSPEMLCLALLPGLVCIICIFIGTALTSKR